MLSADTHAGLLHDAQEGYDRDREQSVSGQSERTAGGTTPCILPKMRHNTTTESCDRV
jgi:hypothetical protein